MDTEKFKSLTLRQLKELIEMEQPDEDQEIRVWVEMEIKLPRLVEAVDL